MYSSEQQQNLIRSTEEFLGRTLTSEDISRVREVLYFHEWKYYVQDNPIISDTEYDQLFKKLEALEKEFPELITPDSPTQRVGQDLTEQFVKVSHLTPMLSLGNTYNQEDLEDFHTSIQKVTEEEHIEYTVEPKFDGGSMALVYENDQLVRAATRGNGAMGEDITANAKVMRTIPLRALFSNYGIAKVEIRGEAVIRKDRFELINEKRLAAGEVAYANPRNTATGGLRTKDPNETADRNIELFAFQISYAEDKNGNDILNSFDTHAATIQMLKELGFKVPEQEFGVYSTIQGAVKHCQAMEQRREEYPYEIDGMVVKVNSFELQELAGMTQHHPRWAVAFKFKAKQATSILEKVEFQVGKIGSITPVAKIKPVQLAGVTVSSISLHNEDFITKKDLRIGDRVLVERAGDVIPYIVKSFPEIRTGIEQVIEFPKECPSCQSALVKVEGESAWRCVDVICPAQAVQRMIHHVSKDAMNIEGFGKSYIERFYELGWLKDVSDIYQLDYEEIASLEGFGKRSAEKLKLAIEEAKKNPLHRLIYSLSIYQVGRKASKLIAQQIDSIFDLQDWTEERYTDIKDIGPILAKEAISFFENQDNIDILHKLKDLGVNMSQLESDQPPKIADDAPLAAKTILFTGTLMQLKRKEAQNLAEKAGAKNVSSVSSNLDILVVGEKAGSKLKKATKLGTVQIITEEEFINIVNS